MFDEQPDGDPHGECAAEIARLTAELKEARQDLRIHEGINVERDARLVQAEERIRYLTMDLEEKERPLDAQMARLNANLIAANEKVLFLDREYGRVCKELNPVRAEVERLTEALDTLSLVVGLTPIAGNKEALQQAVNMARAALTPAEGKT